MERIITASARMLVSFVTLRLKSSKFSFPLAILNIFKNETANVVVFIPPPFEPGDAPIHIKKNNNRTDGNAIPSRLTVEKPADRGVTLKKKAETVLPHSVLCSCRL